MDALKYNNAEDSFVHYKYHTLIFSFNYLYKNEAEETYK